MAVMVVVPAPTAVTLPEEFTVATLVLLDAQVTAVFVAVVGATVAVSVRYAPFLTVAVVELKVTLVTGWITVTVHAAVSPLPSLALAVIVAVPRALPVTTPAETVATDVLLDVQVTA